MPLLGLVMSLRDDITFQMVNIHSTGHHHLNQMRQAMVIIWKGQTVQN